MDVASHRVAPALLALLLMWVCSWTLMLGSAHAAVPTVGFPSWWRGDCDVGHDPGSYRLGAVWHGLVACGPRPNHGGSDVTTYYFSGAWGEYEWECVELSMRWLYQAYGVHPFNANGNAVVDNYSPADGGGLVKIDNGTHGVVPQPGDVLEFAGHPYGHTAVVTAGAVDGSGNGSVTVIEENASATGWNTYDVSSWQVAGAVDWLERRAAAPSARSTPGTTVPSTDVAPVVTAPAQAHPARPRGSAAPKHRSGRRTATRPRRTPARARPARPRGHVPAQPSHGASSRRR